LEVIFGIEYRAIASGASYYDYQNGRLIFKGPQTSFEIRFRIQADGAGGREITYKFVLNKPRRYSKSLADCLIITD